MEPDPEFMFECSECGKKFPATPDSVFESGFSPICEVQKTADCDCDLIAGSDLKEMSEYHLSELGLTENERDRLLSGEPFVGVGAIFICAECHAEIFSAESETCP
jgi:hypothetical protein